MSLRVPLKAGSFLASWVTITFSIRTLLRGVSMFLKTRGFHYRIYHALQDMKSIKYIFIAYCIQIRELCWNISKLPAPSHTKTFLCIAMQFLTLQNYMRLVDRSSESKLCFGVFTTIDRFSFCIVDKYFPVWKTRRLKCVNSKPTIICEGSAKNVVTRISLCQKLEGRGRCLHTIHRQVIS
jgi:hypothetical protein